MDLHKEYVTLSVADGTSMRVYIAHPSKNRPLAGILVFQEAFGVNAHIRDVAERFASQGYLAISPELYHRTAPGFEGSYTDFASVMPHMRALTDANLEADIRAAFERLQAQGGKKPFPTGAVGYCMGGRVACLAAIIEPLVCGISYYGGGIAPNAYSKGLLDRMKDLQAPMLFFWGGRDQHIGPEQVQAVTGAIRPTGKPYANVEFSYADHGFFCDARPSYNAEAAKQAWALTLAFLDTSIAARGGLHEAA